MSTYVKHFDTVSEVLAATKGASFSGGWYGNVTSTQAREYSLSGYASLMTKAEEIFDKVSEAAISLPAMVHTPDVWGQRLNMGEWLAGSPTCFRRKKRSTQEISPMKILVCTTCSAGVDADAMIARGAAILAFLMKLQTIRPVDLYLSSELGNSSRGHSCLATVRIESRPLNLASASFVIGHVGFSRGFLYQYARENQKSGGNWPSSDDCMFSHSSGASSRYITQLASHLDFNPETDMYIPSLRLHDELVNSPVEWINKQLAKYAGDGMELGEE